MQSYKDLQLQPPFLKNGRKKHCLKTAVKNPLKYKSFYDNENIKLQHLSNQLTFAVLIPISSSYLNIKLPYFNN